VGGGAGVVLRRLLRAGAVATAAALAGILVLPPPAEGHAGMVLTLRDDGRGSLSVDVAWDDGHPVTEPIAATLTATSAAGNIGPVALSRLAGLPTVVYEGTLPAGAWEVTVDAALPGIGHCAATVTVGASPGPPGQTRCGDAAAATTTTTTTAGNGVSTIVLVGLIAAGIVALGAVGVLLSRRRAA
jgi:hypothetical protein